VTAVRLDPTRLLLLRLARLALTDQDRHEALRLAPQADWAELQRLAIRGGIAGLVATHATAVGMPRPTLYTLTAHSLAIEAHNRALLALGRALCRQATERGLALLPLKGTALQLDGLYPRPGLRSQCDLDLLTERSQLPALDALLREHGLQHRGDPAYALRHQHHLKYSGSDGHGRNVLVELHWTPFFVTYGHARSDAAALARATEVAAAPTDAGAGEPPLRLLDPVDTLLSVGLHLAVHRYRGQLKWLVDVAELARRDGHHLAWSELWGRATELQAVKALARVFALASELLGAPLPPPPRRGTLGPALLARLSEPTALLEAEDQPPWSRRLLIDLLQRDRPTAALGNLLDKGLELLDRYQGLTLSRGRARASGPQLGGTGRAPLTRTETHGPAGKP